MAIKIIFIVFLKNKNKCNLLYNIFSKIPPRTNYLNQINYNTIQFLKIEGMNK